MKKKIRRWLGIPLFPLTLLFGSLLLRLPFLKVTLLGIIAVGVSVLFCAWPDSGERMFPRGWDREVRRLQRTVEKIRNRDVLRAGSEIVTELKQARSCLPFLTPGARQEICEYYLPSFCRYFTAYRTFEECSEGNGDLIEAMNTVERSISDIARAFRRTCERNERSASLQMKAETEVLRKKLNTEEGTNRVG